MKEELTDPKYTSPAGTLPVYELKMMQQYLHGLNLQKLGEAIPHQRKKIMLIQFFKHKRNQLVQIIWRHANDLNETVGKVEIVGRDFVILTSLFKRYWFPYISIESADTPVGIPNLSSNTHQHIILDDSLRRKLVTHFGKTVASRDVLMQQFFEQSLEVNLKSWKGCTIRVLSADDNITGILLDVEKDGLYIKDGVHRKPVKWSDIIAIQSLRALGLLKPLYHLLTKRHNLPL
jgi:hypothetical protein